MSCIDEQTLGAFVEGTLDARRRREVMEHLDTCESCTIAAGLAAEALREESPAVAEPPASRTWWLAAAAMLATALLGLAVFRDRLFPSSPVRTLVAAVPADRREVEPRLTGGFAWAEYRGPARDSAPAKSDPARLKLQGAAGDVLARSANDASRETKHAAGIALMLIDDAPKSVETLRAIASDDAKVWSDLSAAYFATGRASQYPDALAAADRALRIDPRLPEALFNRALVLERLGLRDEARAAWQRYLDVDASSKWADEAREHLARLTTQSSSFERDLPRLSAAELVARYPQQARTWGEGPFLAEWAEAQQRGDSEKAANALSRARAIGEALAKRSGETLLRDSVAAIDRAADVRPLVEGHLAYRDGRVAYSRRDLAKAANELARAADALARGGSPMASAARYFAANVVYDLDRPDEAFALLSNMLPLTPPSHRALRAQILWQRALCSSTFGRWNESVDDAEVARAIFASLGEDSNRAFVDVIASEALAYGEERDRAWERRIGAFELFSRIGADERLVASLGAAIRSEMHRGNMAAARSLVDIEIERARHGTNRGLAGLALLYRAMLRHRDGDGDPMRDVAEARAIALTGDAARVSAEIDFAEGVIVRARDPRRAVELLTKTAGYARTSFPSYLPATLLERGRAHRDAGDLDDAWADFAAGIDALERSRDPKASSELAFAGLFDDEQSLFGAAVDVALARGDTREAFAYADRAMRHALRSRFPAVRAAAKEKLAADEALVEIYITGDTVRLFCVTPTTIVAANGGSAESIRANVRTLASAALYNALIAPLRTSLASARTIVIVADPRLGFIPFATLFDARSRRYLIEDFEIVVRPATSLPLQPRAQLSSAAPALVVVNPENANVKSLPGAEREAQEVAANYRDAAVLEGRAATRSAVVHALASQRVVHYAGHAASAEQTAGALLLAGGQLYASDIARLDLRATELVVLAACGSSRAAHEAVPRDLATAFAVAGARNVVGTGWEIDDATSVAMFAALHREIAAGARVAAAVRDVQLDAIRAQRHPSTWGALSVMSFEKE